MSVTRAGQIQCKNTQEFVIQKDSKLITGPAWFVDPNNGFSGQVHFSEYSLKNYNYYKVYSDDLGKLYYDVRFFLEGFEEGNPSPETNLSRSGNVDFKDQVIKNKEIYCAVFTPLQNRKYTQKFSLVLYDSKNQVELSVQSFSIPAKQKPQQYEVYFCPESFGVSNDFDQIILKVDRTDSSSANVVMELENFQLYKLQNILDTLVDENNNPITELLGIEIETVNRGECMFFVNLDTFWVGNDKILNIDEDLEISIQKLAYAHYKKSNDFSPSTEEYVTALVNYKY